MSGETFCCKPLSKLITGFVLGLLAVIGMSWQSAALAQKVDYWEQSYGGRNFRTGSQFGYSIAPNLRQEEAFPGSWELMGDHGFGSLWDRSLAEFNDALLSWPAFTASGHQTGYSSGYPGALDTELKVMASKSIAGESGLKRVHLNLSWKFNGDSMENDLNNDDYVAIVGYDHRIGPDMMLILDFIHEKEKDDNEANMLEFGISYRLSPLTVLSLGAGTGLIDDSDEIYSLFGIQHSF